MILGAPDAESAEIAAETLLGDPTCAGALAEVQLGLSVYHVLEDELREQIPDDGYWASAFLVLSGMPLVDRLKRQ